MPARFGLSLTCIFSACSLLLLLLTVGGGGRDTESSWLEAGVGLAGALPLLVLRVLVPMGKQHRSKQENDPETAQSAASGRGRQHDCRLRGAVQRYRGRSPQAAENSSYCKQ